MSFENIVSQKNNVETQKDVEKVALKAEETTVPTLQNLSLTVSKGR